MTTRRARYGDYWRRLPHVSHPLIPTEVALTDPLGRLPEAFPLARMITVVAGLNGVGKTRLLQQVAASVGESSRVLSMHSLCEATRQLHAERHDLDNALDDLEPLSVDEDTRGAVSAIVGRTYESSAWFAFELDDSPFAPIVGDDVIPLFRVESDGASYTTGEMGLGELAAHILIWSLWYLRDQPNLLLLLDEPDAFFPPRSREPLLNHVAKVAVTQQQAFVITSHSREVVERALGEPEVVRYLGRDSGRLTVTTTSGDVREIVQRVLYPRRHVELALLAEDESAHALATALLDRLDPVLNDRLALYWVNGTGDLEELRRRLPRPSGASRGLEFAFVADGDKGPGDIEPSAANRWPFVFLPGGTDPDSLFRKHVPSVVDTLAERLGKPSAVVSALVDRLEGLDPHDWTNDIAAALPALDRSRVLRALADSCLDSSAGDPLLEEFRVSLASSGLRTFAHLS